MDASRTQGLIWFDWRPGCSSIFGLFVQGLACWPRWYLPIRASLSARALRPRAGPGLADRGPTCVPSHLVAPCALSLRPPPVWARLCRCRPREGWTASLASTTGVSGFRFRQSNPRSWKLADPDGVTMMWSCSVTSIVSSASRSLFVRSISAHDGSGTPLG